MLKGPVGSSGWSRNGRSETRYTEPQHWPTTGVHKLALALWTPGRRRISSSALFVEAELILVGSCTSPPEGRHRARERRRSRDPSARPRRGGGCGAEGPRPRPGRRRGRPPRRTARSGGAGERRRPSWSCRTRAESSGGSLRDACAAGARPKMRPVSVVAASVKKSTDRIDPGVREARESPAARDADSGPQRPGREHDAEDAPDRGKQQALGQELANDPGRSGADGRPDRELAAPRRSPGQQQVRDVGARDQKHDAHGREQDPEGRPEVAKHRVVEQGDRGPLTAVGLRILLLEPEHDGFHLAACSLERRSGREPRRARASPSGCPAPANPAGCPSGRPAYRRRRCPRRTRTMAGSTPTIV